MPQMEGSVEVEPRAVTLTRVIDAPVESVWEAWTRPERFARWFGTPPFSTPSSRVDMDVRPGGTWHATQVSEIDGTELPFLGTYREVVAPERLVLTFEDPANRANPNVELATLVLEPIDGTTRMVFRQEGHLPGEQYRLLADGYSRFFDRLEGSLAGDQASSSPGI